MMDNKDYSKLTLEELLTEEKKIKKNEFIVVFIIGLLIGVLIYGVVMKGIGFFHIFFPVVLIIGISRNSQKLKYNLKQIQLEINAKKTKQP